MTLKIDSINNWAKIKKFSAETQTPLSKKLKNQTKTSTHSTVLLNRLILIYLEKFKNIFRSQF